MESLTSGSSGPPAVQEGRPAAADRETRPAMEYGHLTAEDKERFWDDGFLVKRGYFDDEEVGFVRRALVEDASLRDNVIDRHEAFGAPRDRMGSQRRHRPRSCGAGRARICSARSRAARDWWRGRSSCSAARYNYHHAINMKPPGGGGSFRWHQDFGYWYENGTGVNGGAKMPHARRPGGPVAAAQKCATYGPLSVLARGGGCTAWSSMRRFGWRLLMRG